MTLVDHEWPRGGRNIHQSLVSLQKTLLDWNVRSFGNVYKRKRKAMARLNGVQLYLQDNPRSEFHQELEVNLQEEIIRILAQEEELWRSKSRMERLGEGERNMRFFHRSVLIKRRASKILSLCDDVGNEVTDPESIRDLIVKFYHHLYTSDHVTCKRDSEASENSTNIVGVPTREEIRLALFSMKPMKAPGPDGFHPIFFQETWDITGNDLVTNIQNWFMSGNIPEELGNALICLIPKNNAPETVKQFRPISLCNTLYKVVTKILVNRMKPLISGWISPNQNSFIKGRGPEINLVVTSEILHTMTKKSGRWGWFALKIDLEKAYDRIEWSFMRRCLECHDLDEKSISLIMNCVSQASSSVLVNGKKSERFHHSRGLRQGDPMSPYLFNICLEALSQMIHKECEEKEWTPFGVGRKKVPVSHLMFADDLILFGRVDETTAFSVRRTFERFCEFSGQKINESKSKLTFSRNTPEEMRVLFQNTLNVSESEDLRLYLGLPISHKRPNRSQVQFVVDKVRARLAKWKTSFLSKAGRLCLINSTLSSIPAYYMQAACLPAQTIKDLDQICNNFMWGASDQGRKGIHLVQKEITFTPKELGGLGIRDQGKMNKAYMAKLGWKMSQDAENLAQKCIKPKYFHKDHVTRFANGSAMWKNIGKGWDLLQKHCNWNVGDGRTINVWEDNWLGIGPIRHFVEGPIGQDEHNYVVADLVNQGEWDLTKLSFLLP